MKQNKENRHCKVIGLTGGVGTGKTTVALLLKEKYNIPVIIADEYGHKVMEPGTICYKQIVETFGTGICKEDGTINRKELGDIVFSDKEKLTVLNEMVHPAVQKSIQNDIAELAKNQEIRCVIMESAILFESNFDSMCDEIWCVYTSDEVRRERLKVNRGYSDEKIDAILQNQMSAEVMRERADCVILNDGEQNELEKQLEKIIYMNFGLE